MSSLAFEASKSQLVVLPAVPVSGSFGNHWGTKYRPGVFELLLEVVLLFIFGTGFGVYPFESDREFFFFFCGEASGWGFCLPEAGRRKEENHWEKHAPNSSERPREKAHAGRPGSKGVSSKSDTIRSSLVANKILGVDAPRDLGNRNGGYTWLRRCIVVTYNAILREGRWDGWSRPGALRPSCTPPTACH